MDRMSSWPVFLLWEKPWVTAVVFANNSPCCHLPHRHGWLTCWCPSLLVPAHFFPPSLEFDPPARYSTILSYPLSQRLWEPCLIVTLSAYVLGILEVGVENSLYTAKRRTPFSLPPSRDLSWPPCKTMSSRKNGGRYSTQKVSRRRSTEKVVA